MKLLLFLIECKVNCFTFTYSALLRSPHLSLFKLGATIFNSDVYLLSNMNLQIC